MDFVVLLVETRNLACLSAVPIARLTAVNPQAVARICGELSFVPI
jgi:hypothetical protein